MADLPIEVNGINLLVRLAPGRCTFTFTCLPPRWVVGRPTTSHVQLRRWTCHPVGVASAAR